MVKLKGKKVEKYFIAIILEQNATEYTVKFMRKSTMGNFFIFPNVDDVSLISAEDVVKILPQPTVTKRKQYYFNATILKAIKHLL